MLWIGQDFIFKKAHLRFSIDRKSVSIDRKSVSIDQKLVSIDQNRQKLTENFKRNFDWSKTDWINRKSGKTEF